MSTEAEEQSNAFYYRNLDPGETPSKGKWNKVRYLSNVMLNGNETKLDRTNVNCF